MGSSRLPGKVLADLGGRPLLEQLLRRLAPSTRLTQLVVATTKLPEDDAVAALAARGGVSCYRGSVDDVLDRYFQAAREHRADVVVRLTGDNPLVDGSFVDQSVEAYLERRPDVDYLDTGSSKSYPVGLSVEVIAMEALAQAWKEAREPADREHVTRFIRNRGNRFHIHSLAGKRDDSDLRWTVDRPEDLTSVRLVFDALDLDRHLLGYEQIVAAVRADPGLRSQ